MAKLSEAERIIDKNPFHSTASIGGVPGFDLLGDSRLSTP
jgi:hypothetical protein